MKIQLVRYIVTQGLLVILVVLGLHTYQICVIDSSLLCAYIGIECISFQIESNESVLCNG